MFSVFLIAVRVSRGHKFDVKTPLLLQLTKIRIRLENAGALPSWYLERVVIRDPRTDDEFQFDCGRWLNATEQPDGCVLYVAQDYGWQIIFLAIVITKILCLNVMLAPVVHCC